jgi:membrane protease YdiL (CAAX protease family)
VFGLWPTSILFALIHMQYTLTPATLIILGVALGFGWLRQRYNTTVAIMAHFLYNFIPLAVNVYAPEETASWIVRLF